MEKTFVVFVVVCTRRSFNLTHNISFSFSYTATGHFEKKLGFSLGGT